METYFIFWFSEKWQLSRVSASIQTNSWKNRQFHNLVKNGIIMVIWGYGWFRNTIRSLSVNFGTIRSQNGNWWKRKNNFIIFASIEEFWKIETINMLIMPIMSCDHKTRAFWGLWICGIYAIRKPCVLGWLGWEFAAFWSLDVKEFLWFGSPGFVRFGYPCDLGRLGRWRGSLGRYPLYAFRALCNLVECKSPHP